MSTLKTRIRHMQGLLKTWRPGNSRLHRAPNVDRDHRRGPPLMTQPRSVLAGPHHFHRSREPILRCPAIAVASSARRLPLSHSAVRLGKVSLSRACHPQTLPVAFRHQRFVWTSLWERSASGSEMGTRSAAEVGQLGSGGRFGPVGTGPRIRDSDDGRNVFPTALLQPGQESLRRRRNGSATGSGDCERRR